MWLVRIALKRPYTFVVLSLLIVLLGGVTIRRIPTDVFPDIDIPVVSVIWNYGGLPPEQMERRIVTNFERFVTTVVNDIEHIESQSLTGTAVIKVFLQPGADIDSAVAQLTAVAQSAVRQMPPGSVPPLIIRYSASNVPIMQAALESDTMSEQQLFDLGVNFVRADIATIRGAQVPWPYGGKQRQIMIDIDPARLYAAGLSPRDVNAALGLQNLVLPSGTVKIGAAEYPVVLNSSPDAIEELAAIPLKTVAGRTLYLRDVANVRDGSPPQTSIVHVGGKKAALMTILKSGHASTLDVTGRIKAMMPRILSRLPKELKVSLLFDQSLFVRAAVEGVVKEALIAAALTALMILLFLGSWRSTLIVVISIPLAILTSIIALGALGHTLNVMTLGGLALAVGILVDDATVEIENIHRNLVSGKPLVRAIMDGAQQIATPAFVSTLCICIVFVPVVFIAGSAKYLFTPMAMAVVFAMLMSYFLSRTIVPTLVRYLLRGEAARHAGGPAPTGRAARLFERLFARFEARFEALRRRYGGALAWALQHRGRTVALFVGLFAVSGALYPLIGQDFFPAVDAGLIKLHARLPPGTRIEETERRFVAIEEVVRQVIPTGEIDTLIDNMGIPASSINLSLSEGALVSSADGQILIALKEGHAPTARYVARLRRALRQRFPDLTFFFLAPDISTQVLNFGLPAPIDLQVTGAAGGEAESYALARRLAAEVAEIPGAVDVHLAQVEGLPQLRIDVDRTMASRAGLTQRDVASDVLVSLSSSGQVAPSFWVDRRGVQYLVAVQTPQREVGTVEQLMQTPLSTAAGAGPQLLSNVAAVARDSGAVNVTHVNAIRTYDVQANVEGADLGSVARGIDRVLARLRRDLPRGAAIEVKGQVASMRASFSGLAVGLLFAVVLVYLLMAVNFQSWLDPLIILMALPGALSGIAWILFLTQTTLSVPALMGAIMCVGVATANSILVVTFANDQRGPRSRGEQAGPGGQGAGAEPGGPGRDARQAALLSGITRLRPVLMTALAMIIGMLPMSLGLGEGGEQNAPLGRAVIGGLLLATLTTLFFVPVVYSLLRRRADSIDEEVEAL